MCGRYGRRADKQRIAEAMRAGYVNVFEDIPPFRVDGNPTGTRSTPSPNGFQPDSSKVAPPSSHDSVWRVTLWLAF
jgi:hypothetical protein